VPSWTRPGHEIYTDQPSRWRNVRAAHLDNDAAVDARYAMTPPDLLERSPPPDLANIRDFIRFHASVARGNLDPQGRPTTDSVNTFAEWFFAGFARVTGNWVDTKDRKAVYKVRYRETHYDIILAYEVQIVRKDYLSQRRVGCEDEKEEVPIRGKRVQTIQQNVLD